MTVELGDIGEKAQPRHERSSPTGLPEARRLGATEMLAGLTSEALTSAGYLILNLVANWVLFADGPLFEKVRGRLYSWLFGWGRGVGIARFVDFREVRSIKIGDYTRIQRDAIIGGPVTIGRYCWIGERDVIYPGTTIGDMVGMGPLVYVITRWHEMGPPRRRTGPIRQRAIRIGDGASINGGAMILAGCQIGEGAVVAGGAKVTRSVPPHVVVAGNPAVIVHRLEPAP